MPHYMMKGSFYEFHRDQPHREIGHVIQRKSALLRVLRGDDVYTPADSDARSLAKDVQKGKPDWEGAHGADFYPHYHPGGNHGYGHIFYNDRGYRVGENRRS